MTDNVVGSPSDAFEALDRVLDELRREFRANPEFAMRVVQALGSAVHFDSDLKTELLNPVELVANRSSEEVQRTLSDMEISDLKKLAKSSNLATPTDLSGRSKDEIVAMIQVRAERRVQSRSAD
jgi:hypothetical protein